MIKNQTEIWKSHPDIPGIEVSTFGRVRTLDKVVSSEKMTRFTKGHVLNQHDNGNGYLQVNVQGDRKVVRKYVHRLVAQTFIPNPDNLPQVNHKDCDREITEHRISSFVQMITTWRTKRNTVRLLKNPYQSHLFMR